MRRTSIILLSVALALLAFIVFFERGSLSTSEREGRKGRVLDSFVRERVTRIEVQRRGVTTVLVHVPPDPDDPLDAGGWRVEKPYQAKADRDTVDSLISALEWIEARRSLGDASAEELKRFGLSAPRYRVRFLAGREESGFSLGGPAADGGGLYLQLRGKGAVYVVGNDLLEALNHEPADYHNKELHEGLTVHTLERLSIRSGTSAEIRLARKEGFDWLESPYAALASTPGLTAVVDALDALRASRYIADAPSAAYGLETPRLEVAIESLVYDRKAAMTDKEKKGKPSLERLEFRIGAACAGHAGESYLRVNKGPIYCASDSELKKLEKAPEDLRETRVLPLEDARISGVELRAGTRELSLETGDKDTRYHLRDGAVDQSGTADPTALQEWYAALRSAAIERFSALDPDSRAKLEAGATVATFKRGKTEAAYVIRVARSDAAAIGTRLSEPALLQLPAAASELLAPTVARFRKKRALEEPELEFSTLSVTRADHSVEVVAKTKNGYELREPVVAPADRATVDEWVRLVSKLDAVRFVADRARPEYGFAAPHLSLRIEYEANGQRRVHTLTLAAVSGEDGRYATLDDDPAVFIVPAAVARKLDEPLKHGP